MKKSTPTRDLAHRDHSRRGTALVELLCASALAVMVLGGTIVTFAAVQRSLIASLYQMNAQNDQSRVFAYLRRDLRGASSVQIASQGTQLTVLLPAPSSSPMNQNLGAALLSLLVPTPTVPTNITVRYYRQGTSIIREVDGAATSLSASATRFQASLQGAVVQIDTGFQPRFSLGIKNVVGLTTAVSSSVHLLNALQP